MRHLWLVLFGDRDWYESDELVPESRLEFCIFVKVLFFDLNDPVVFKSNAFRWPGLFSLLTQLPEHIADAGFRDETQKRKDEVSVVGEIEQFFRVRVEGLKCPEYSHENNTYKEKTECSSMNQQNLDADSLVAREFAHELVYLYHACYQQQTH